MLQVRLVNGDGPWELLEVDTPFLSLVEDQPCAFALMVDQAVRLFIDDAEVHRSPDRLFRWTPKLFAGRVTVQLAATARDETRVEVASYSLDISPSPRKSTEGRFAEMLDQVRAFDAGLLLGSTGGTREFGRDDTDAVRSSRLHNHVALWRIRQHGPAFLKAVAGIARRPHRTFASEQKMLPLSRIKQLHHSALNDHRVAAIALGKLHVEDDLGLLQLQSQTSAATFDTPANRVILSQLHRFRAHVRRLLSQIEHLELSGDESEQVDRRDRRIVLLGQLDRTASMLLRGAPFNDVTQAPPSAAGLTQLAALPHYTKAHRLGARALAKGWGGAAAEDRLAVPPSWDIYEVWCLLSVMSQLESLLPDAGFSRIRSMIANAELAYGLSLPNGDRLELLFQATFPAGRPHNGRIAWSISRQRIPDILLVQHGQGCMRALVLDAKWRAGRDSLLQAMESAHIYHDSLRLGTLVKPAPCLLLAPSEVGEPSLEHPSFIAEHGVGAIGHYQLHGKGLTALPAHLRQWLGSVQGG
jgi:hypothetical protein